MLEKNHNNIHNITSVHYVNLDDHRIVKKCRENRITAYNVMLCVSITRLLSSFRDRVRLRPFSVSSPHFIEGLHIFDQQWKTRRKFEVFHFSRHNIISIISYCIKQNSFAGHEIFLVHYNRYLFQSIYYTRQSQQI